jgi:uncharacterized membrane protein
VSRGYGDIEGQIQDAGRFAIGLRRGRGVRRWGAVGLMLLFAVPLGIAMVLGITEAILRLF